MKQITIPSFQIDHRLLDRGLYTSQSMALASNIIIDTLDIRVCTPYLDKPMTPAVAHTIEHIGATFLRSKWPDNIIYFGPMGCLTGFYLVLYLTPSVPNPYLIVTELFEAIIGAKIIPGATEKECGNCFMMDLAGAKLLAAKYLNNLIANKNKYDGKTRYSY